METQPNLNLLKNRLNAFQKQMILLSVSLNQDIQTDTEVVNLLEMTLEVLKNSKATIKMQREASLANRRSVRELQFALKLSHRDPSQRMVDTSGRLSPSPIQQLRYIPASVVPEREESLSRYDLSKRHSKLQMLDPMNSFDRAVEEAADNKLKESKSKRLLREKEAYENQYQKIKEGLQKISKGESHSRDTSNLVRTLTGMMPNQGEKGFSSKKSERLSTEKSMGGSNQPWKTRSSKKPSSIQIRNVESLGTPLSIENTPREASIPTQSLMNKIAQLKAVQGRRGSRTASTQNVTPKRVKTGAFKFERTQKSPEINSPGRIESRQVMPGYAKKRGSIGSQKIGQEGCQSSAGRLKTPVIKYDIFSKRKSMQVSLASQEAELSKKFDKYLGPLRKGQPKSARNALEVPSYQSGAFSERPRIQRDFFMDSARGVTTPGEQDEPPTRGIPESDLITEPKESLKSRTSHAQSKKESRYSGQGDMHYLYESPMVGEFQEENKQSPFDATDPACDFYPQQDLPIFKKK